MIVKSPDIAIVKVKPETKYEKNIHAQMRRWQKQMVREPSLISRLSRKLQNRMNNLIPEKIHQVITTTLKQMIRAVLFGARYTAAKPLPGRNIDAREAAIQQRIEFYRKTAAVEGGITGAGGIFTGLADFPILIAIKIKLLFDIASLYGFNIKDYRERLYILHIFELAFSGDENRKRVFLEIENWDERSRDLPEDINQFDWRNFQQEYRDYIDLAKMAQLLPGIGAPVGVVVNNRLIKKLGITAMNSYRMRLFV
ncbi:MAG TPA: EcsC family protein [Bacteroidales bacterium]|nr:EcsC family protein [Bacteroidales bacterium]